MHSGLLSLHSIAQLNNVNLCSSFRMPAITTVIYSFEMRSACDKKGQIVVFVNQ